VLRRLDCVLAAIKPAVRVEHAAKTKAGLNTGTFLLRKAGESFYSTSPLGLVPWVRIDPMHPSIVSRRQVHTPPLFRHAPRPSRASWPA